MTTVEHEDALGRSARWVAGLIDLRHASDRELLQLIAQQPVGVVQGAGRALAARWEAQRRGLVPPDDWSSDAPRHPQPVRLREPAPLLGHRDEQTEPDALLVSLILDESL
jgi:predicted signal transduction protein with EAL and GGDEF domain